MGYLYRCDPAILVFTIAKYFRGRRLSGVGKLIKPINLLLFALLYRLLSFVRDEFSGRVRVLDPAILIEMLEALFGDEFQIFIFRFANRNDTSERY